jgi:endonuclease/exonuclease/phosphatase family metal-dependent hydrolase
MTTTLRLVTWNLQADQQSAPRRKLIRDVLLQLDADILCLTEAFPHNIPADDPQSILSSELSDWKPEDKGARKVILWSRWGWTQTDTIGSPRLPEGRFIAATTQMPSGQTLNIVGVCIPWHGYRTNSRWNDQRKGRWQGNIDYLNALREDVLSQPHFGQHTIILGDFNLQIPPMGYPSKAHEINPIRQQTFQNYRIPTAELASEQADFERVIEQDKPVVDHIALTPDLQPVALRVFSRFSQDEHPMTDHNGIFMKVRV